MQMLVSPNPLAMGLQLYPLVPPTQASNVISISYAPPTLSSISPSYNELISNPLTASTEGGYAMTLIG